MPIIIQVNVITGRIEVMTGDWAENDPRWADLDRGTYLATATEVAPWAVEEESMDRATVAVRDILGFDISDWRELRGVNGELRFATVAGRI